MAQKAKPSIVAAMIAAASSQALTWQQARILIRAAAELIDTFPAARLTQDRSQE
jgi:hypothetical protein